MAKFRYVQVPPLTDLAAVRRFLTRLEDEIAQAVNGIPESGKAQEATGAATPSLGSNGPMSVTTAPYTYLKSKTNDGTIVWIPAWK